MATARAARRRRGERDDALAGAHARAGRGDGVGQKFRFLTTTAADWSSRSGTAVFPLALTYALVLIISARYRTSATHFYFVCARRNHNKEFLSRLWRISRPRSPQTSPRCST